MFDDFFIRALIAGVGIAIVTGPIGCFVIWRRLAYYGDTLAHVGPSPLTRLKTPAGTPAS